jgi:hypothetical protein
VQGRIGGRRVCRRGALGVLTFGGGIIAHRTLSDLGVVARVLVRRHAVNSLHRVRCLDAEARRACLDALLLLLGEDVDTNVERTVALVCRGTDAETESVGESEE